MMQPLQGCDILARLIPVAALRLPPATIAQAFCLQRAAHGIDATHDSYDPEGVA